MSETNIEKLERAAKKVVETFDKHRSFGTTDTEPQHALRYCIAQTFRLGELKMPAEIFSSGNHWDIYSSMDGWRLVSAELDTATEELLKALLYIRLSDIKNAKRLLS